MSQSLSVRRNLLLLPLLVLVAAALPYFVNLGKSALWDGNETFYAETPREMLETGNLLAPQFNYEPRPQKPPLTYWAVLLGYKIVGIRELGVRLPGAFAVVGILLFTFGMGRMLYSPRAGLLAAAILATTLRIYILARKLPIDLLLLFWLTGTAYFIIRAAQKDLKRDWLLAYLFAGLGFLTKGPIAWALPGLSYVVWSLWMRRFKFRGVHPLAGISILALVTVPWYLMMYLGHRWIYIADFFLQDNFARFATEVRGPVRGPFYYFPVLFGDFFPWSILLIAVAAALWFGRSTLRSRDSLSCGLPLVWCGITFLLFSISKNKQEYYIAPLYPVMAALLGGVMDRSLLPGSALYDRLRSYWRGLFLVVALLFLAIAALLPFLLPALIPNGPIMLHYVPTALLISAAAVLIWEVRRCRLESCVISTAISLWLVFILSGAVYLPALEPLRPVKEICRAIEARVQSGDEIGYYRAAVPSMLFYLRRPIYSVSDPDTMVRMFEGTKRVFCVLGERDFDYFTGKRALGLHVINRYQQLPTQLHTMLGNKRPTGEDLLLVTNRPPDIYSDKDRGKNQ
jgi:4-amino-4-deoxy-L-arabinose transferase-like glycosyltransferase